MIDYGELIISLIVSVMIGGAIIGAISYAKDIYKMRKEE